LKRTEYVDLMCNHLVRKWDARGRYVEIGKTGAVYRTHAGLRDVKGSLTQPHNKHHIIIEGLVNLYRLTGNDDYMRKAVRLGTRYKRCLKLKDGHYEWNYWDPAGAWDVNPAEPAKWKHWIGVEHKGGYYASSLTQAVVLYDCGLVFDKTDMDRFTKTQTEMAWNGDVNSPQWSRCDGSKSERYMQGTYVCSALAPFDRRIYDLVYVNWGRQQRLARPGHPWQGGVVAAGWLAGKFVQCPSAEGGKPAHPEVGEKFLQKPENRALVQALSLEVTGAGYAAPRTPADMKPMPGASTP